MCKSIPVPNNQPANQQAKLYSDWHLYTTCDNQPFWTSNLLNQRDFPPAYIITVNTIYLFYLLSNFAFSFHLEKAPRTVKGCTKNYKSAFCIPSN